MSVPSSSILPVPWLGVKCFSPSRRATSRMACASASERKLSNTTTHGSRESTRGCSGATAGSCSMRSNVFCMSPAPRASGKSGSFLHRLPKSAQSHVAQESAQWICMYLGFASHSPVFAQNGHSAALSLHLGLARLRASRAALPHGASSPPSSGSGAAACVWHTSHARGHRACMNSGFFSHSPISRHAAQCSS